MFYKHCLIVPLALSMIGFSISTHAQANTEEQPESSDTLPIEETLSRFEIGEELFFTLELKQLNLGEVNTIKNTNELFVELASFFQAVDFPIVESYESNTIFEGWYLNPENLLNIKLINEQKILITYGNKELEVASELFTFEFDQLYLDATILETIFRFEFIYDYDSLVINLKTEQPLPIEARLARQNRQLNYYGTDDYDFPELFRGYALLSPQIFDIQLNARHREQSGDNTASYSLIASREIARVNANLGLSGFKDDMLRSGRLTLSRTSPESNMLGILGASNIEVGDIIPVQVGSLQTNNMSAGVRIDNTTSRRRLDQLTTTLSGNVQIGWDIEVYRNDVLIETQTNLQETRYQFNNIDLFIGENRFEIRKFGPQGQIEIDRYREVVDGRADNRRPINYQFSIVQNNRTLLGIEDNGDREQDLAIGLSMSTGLNEYSTADIGISYLAGDSGDTSIIAGYNTRLFDTQLLRVYAQRQQSDNYEVGLNWRTQYFGHSISAGINSYFDNTNSDIDSRNQLNFAISGSTQMFQRARLSYSNQIFYNEQGDNDSLALRNSVSIRTPIGEFVNAFTYSNTNISADSSTIDTDNIDVTDVLNDENVDQDPADLLTENTSSEIFSTNELFGSVGYRHRFKNALFRLSASYERNTAQESSLDFTALNAEITYTPIKQLRAYGRISDSLIDDNRNYSLNLDWRADLFDIGLGYTYSTIGGSEISLNTRMSIGGEPYTQGLIQRSRSMTSNGTIVVRVFHDKNSNGIFDGRDLPIENIEVRTGRNRPAIKTNLDGISTLTDLSTNNQTPIFLNNTSDTNPFLVPLIDGVKIQAREAFVDTLDFPMVEISELEGYVTARGELFNVRGITARLDVHLVKGGKIVQSTTTEPDGYYFFNSVKPGNYEVKVSSPKLDMNYVKADSSPSVLVGNVSDVIMLDNINLEKIPVLQGFLVSIGSFDNDSLANLHLSRFVKSFGALAPDPRVVLDESQKAVASIAFVKSENEGQKLCELVSANNSRCSIIPHIEIL